VRSVLIALVFGLLVAPSAQARQRLLALDHRVVVRAAPDPASRAVAKVSAKTPLTGNRMMLPVIGARQGPNGGRWLEVRLPMRPNGATGWLPAYEGRRTTTPWRIVVHTRTRTTLVLKNGHVRATFSAIVGSPSTPTPLGHFFVVEKLYVGPYTEGPWALATSGYSNVFQEFAGGPGQIALHGTQGLSGYWSHGCVRLAPGAVSWIARHVGRGTPVLITR
jgi:lipoprotein-anchoring transpeptidase ErfK/SrfK